jgi:hypothetical protein
MIFGEDGYFLKLTTRNCDVDIIWHDRHNNMFLFWGPSIYAVVQAMNQIRGRIIKYTIYMKPQQAISTQPQQAISTQPQQAISTQPQQAISTQPQQAISTQPQQALSTQPQQDGIEDISDDDDEYADMPPLMTWDGKIVN